MEKRKHTLVENADEKRYEFDLGDDIPPPPVQGGDDAALAETGSGHQKNSLRIVAATTK